MKGESTVVFLDQTKIKEVKLPGFTLAVYSNRIEITDRRGFAGLFKPKNTAIPIRTIASVDTVGMTENLSIKTLDGRQYTYKLGGFGKAAKEIRTAILERM